MSDPTYTISHISDLLDVPADRREACVKNVLLSLSLYELALGEYPESRPLSVAWVDDGKNEVGIRDEEGKDFLTVKFQEMPT